MKIKHFIRTNLGFALGLLLLFSFRWSLADQYHVPSGSMRPGLQIGDRIGVLKSAFDLKIPFTEMTFYKVSEPTRGEVIVFLWPGDNSSVYVKRLIGIPGDHVKIKDGFVSINGTIVPGTLRGRHLMGAENNSAFVYDEQLGDKSYSVQRFPQFVNSSEIDIIVPQDSYFFMGDNRDDSADSRAWGFVKREALKGRVEKILFNLNFEGFIPTMDFTRFWKDINNT